MVFNTTFNNISVISWWSVLFVEDIFTDIHQFYFFTTIISHFIVFGFSLKKKHKIF
jgi:hypothetical protein